MKKKHFPIYTTPDKPDIEPFSMLTVRVWEKYDLGELDVERLALMAVLYRHVNPHNGTGVTSYAKICTWLQLPPNANNSNHINKLMTELRDAHQLIWFPEHKGSRDFAYVVSDFKFAKNQKNEPRRWIDTKRYFRKEQSESRGSDIPTNTPPPEAKPSNNPPQQRLERTNDGSVPHIAMYLPKDASRAPQTNTETQT